MGRGSGARDSGTEFAQSEAPGDLGDTTIGPGAPIMVPTYPGPKGVGGLHQGAKAKFRLSPRVSGYRVSGIGLSGIGYRVSGYRANGRVPAGSPVWGPRWGDHRTFARSVRSAPRAPRALVLGTYHPPARPPCARSDSAGSLLLCSFCSRLDCSVLSALVLFLALCALLLALSSRLIRAPWPAAGFPFLRSPKERAKIVPSIVPSKERRTQKKS